MSRASLLKRLERLEKVMPKVDPEILKELEELAGVIALVYGEECRKPLSLTTTGCYQRIPGRRTLTEKIEMVYGGRAT